MECIDCGSDYDLQSISLGGVAHWYCLHCRERIKRYKMSELWPAIFEELADKARLRKNVKRTDMINEKRARLLMERK